MSRSNQLAGLITATPTSTLDTINEINTSLNNDNDLSGTLSGLINAKASKSGDTFTGNVIVNKAGTTTEPTMRVTSALESSSGIHSHGFSATFLNTSNNANAHGVAIGSKHADSNSLIIGQHDTTFDHFIVKGDGNVGVGVDPSSKLHVYDSADHTRLSVQCANSSGRHWQFQSRNDGLFWIRDDTAGANRMIFNSSGQVGIGCTPSHHLHIEPSGWTDSYCTLRLKHPDSSAMKFATLDIRADDDKGLQLGVGSSGTSTSNFYRQSYIESYSRDLNLSTYTGGYNITFRTAPSGGSASERLRIAHDGTVQITDALSGSQQSTQDFKIGRATIQVANVNTTSATAYGAGFTFKTHDYNGSSFVNHDALRITARGDVVVGHDNYMHGTAHDPNEGSHGTALLKTNGDFVQTGGDYDPRSGTSETLFTPYHRRTMISNIGRNVGASHDTWYMWYKIDGVDGIYANGSTPYIELRIIGHTGHHSGSICRVIMITPASNDTGHDYLSATQMGKNGANRGYGQTLEVFLYGNTNGANDVYMMIKQAQREPHVTIVADLYATTRNMHSINNFGIIYYGGGTANNTTEPSNVGTHRASFTN